MFARVALSESLDRIGPWPSASTADEDSERRIPGAGTDGASAREGSDLGAFSAAEHELRAGTPREQVIAKLEALRAGLSDSDKDVVLEVLDFVTGWCSPHVRL